MNFFNTPFGKVLTTIVLLTVIVASVLVGYAAFQSGQHQPTDSSTNPSSCDLGDGRTLLSGQVHPDDPAWMCKDGDIVLAPEGISAINVHENDVFVPQGNYVTSCEGWDTTAGAVNILHPGQTARLDGCADGVCYYDIGGVGQGTSIRNMSTHDTTITPGGDWSGGCENTTNLAYLVNKDLVNGCGTHCDEARIVTISNSGVTEKVYTEQIEE